MASWYKRALKTGLLSRIFVDKKKIAGGETEEQNAKERIYRQYLSMFKNGIYDVIREDEDPVSGEMIPRKYFSGGVTLLVGTAGVLTERPLTEAGNVFLSTGRVFDVSVEGIRRQSSSAVREITETFDVHGGQITGDFVFYTKPNGSKDEEYDKKIKGEVRFLQSVIIRLIENNDISLAELAGQDHIKVEEYAHTRIHDLYLISISGREEQYVVKICNESTYVSNVAHEWKILNVLQKDLSAPRPDIVIPVMRGPAFYIVTKFLPGEDLFTILQKGPLTTAETVALGLELSDAVAYTDDKKIVVRDINAHNIRILFGGPKGKVGRIGPIALFDFNVSMPHDYDWEHDPEDLKTSVDQSIFAEDRMEKSKYRIKPDVQSDIYSIGVTLLSTVVPASVDLKSLDDIMQALKYIKDDRLRAIIQKAISPRSERFKNAAQLKEALATLNTQLIDPPIAASNPIEVSAKIKDDNKVWIGRGSTMASSGVGDNKVGGIDLREQVMNLDMRGSSGVLNLPDDPKIYDHIIFDGLIPVIDQVRSFQGITEFMRTGQSPSGSP